MRESALQEVKRKPFRKIEHNHKFNDLISEAAEIVKDICVAVKFLHDMNIAHRWKDEDI